MINDQKSLDELKQAATVLKSGKSSDLKTLSDKLDELCANIEGKHAEQLKKNTRLWRGASISLLLVCLILGLVVIFLLRPTPQSAIVITSPKTGDVVTMTIPVTGTVAKAAITDGRSLYVFVRPHGLTEQDQPLDYWVQPTPVINNDGTWQASKVGVGTPEDPGRSFDICAVLTSHTITDTHFSALPPGPAFCNMVTRE
jgi:hypothetical protein